MTTGFSLTFLLLIIAGFFLLAVLGAMVVVFVQGRRIGGRPDMAPDMTPDAIAQSRAPLTGDVAADARALLGQGKKLEAIKRVRELSGLGLKEAKEYVDALEAGQSPLEPARVAAAPPAVVADPAAVEAEARALLADGRAIEAIKLVRQRTGLGLKEAKDYVDALGARE